MHTFLIIGGDSRQDYLKQYLEQDGFAVLRWTSETTPAFFEDTSGSSGGSDSSGSSGAFDSSGGSGAFDSSGNSGSSDPQDSLIHAMEQADVILCPVPFTNHGPDPAVLLSGLKAGHILFGGAIPETVISHCARLGIPVHDFMKMEEVALKNTVATAEGAVAEAIALSPGVLHGSRCLVTGFGRCGETLAAKLKGLDARVTAADRSSVRLALAYSQGYRTLLIDQPFSGSSTCLSDFDFIFNTIPSLVLEPSALRLLKADALLIDIASAPGGFAWQSENILEHKNPGNCGSNCRILVKRCPGLPGRYCPKAAAEILYQALLSHLQ